MSISHIATALEDALAYDGYKPQPQGSITVEQYAELRELSAPRAQGILSYMVKRGVARREWWNRRYIYYVNKTVNKKGNKKQ